MYSASCDTVIAQFGHYVKLLVPTVQAWNPIPALTCAPTYIFLGIIKNKQ